MDASLVKIDNVIAWDGAKAPFVENYSFFLQDPHKDWSLCIRFSFEVASLQSPKLGVVEAFFQNAAGERQAFRQEYNLDDHDIVHADKFVDIGGCYLSLADSMGTLHAGNNTLKWECVFEDPVVSQRPFPDIFYPFAFPRYKMVYPRFLNFARGQFFINHKKYEFSRIRVCQNHGYGKQLPQSLNVHAVGFEQDSTAVFSLFAPRFVSKKGLMPYLPCVIFSMEGKTFVDQPLSRFLFQRSLNVTDFGFDLTFHKRPYRFLASMACQPEHNFALSDGALLNIFADLRIEVQKKSHGIWQTYKVLTSSSPAVCIKKV